MTLKVFGVFSAVFIGIPMVVAIIDLWFIRPGLNLVKRAKKINREGWK